MPTTNTTRPRQPLAAGCPPVWASAWGEDRYGPWAEFELPTGEGTQVSQRLRWVPPGEFLMGSPESDNEAFENERPQHVVRICEGYWLFDTPCTQELWQAVREKNPSRFSGQRRPVENVSWLDCDRFVAELNARVVGLRCRLPTEAEWEYACRAGTTESRYGLLDEIAWSWENSGQQTHEVGLKAPNVWGLYDMLGNVWEWCIDGMRKYTEEQQANPIGSTEVSVVRVHRGGSWHSVAQDVRAAYRFVFHLDLRFDFLGFRCLSSGGRAES